MNKIWPSSRMTEQISTCLGHWALASWYTCFQDFIHKTGIFKYYHSFFFKGFRNINDKKTPTRKTKQKDSGFSRCLYFAKMSWGESGEFAQRTRRLSVVNSHQNVEVVQRSSEIQKSRRHVILFGSDRSDQLCKIQILVVVSKFLYEPILRILCKWVESTS